ncbi:MAG TPA: hypothetical protein VHX65_16355 [Pirellulales bacterium]|jgi:hypothetical protein|nr:hypothetical protein [Pirellulales bacterium]
MKSPNRWKFLLSAVLFAAGCGGPTEVDRDNRRAVDQLLTAITLRSPSLLDAAAKRVATRHSAGQLTDEESQSLEAIIQKAHAGNWGAAETDGYEFRKQNPFVREGR